MAKFIFDSFALTALVEDEPGRTRVSEIIEDARSGVSQIAMSVVNLGESLYTARRRRQEAGLVYVLNLFAGLPIELVNADLSLTISAARIKAVIPIAFGDCFAAALAIERSATLVTGDPEFERLSNAVTIEWLPQLRRRR